MMLASFAEAKMSHYDLVNELLICEECGTKTPLKLPHEYNASSIDLFDFGHACVEFQKKHRDCFEEKK